MLLKLWQQLGQPALIVWRVKKNDIKNELVLCQKLQGVHIEDLRSIGIEQWFYQHHRLLGILITFGACYIIVYFGLLFDKHTTLQSLTGYAPNWQRDILLDALVLVALTGAVVALFVGLFLWLRPSLLRGIEASANQWISSDRAVRVLEVPHDQVERFVARHFQRIGWLLLVASVYLFFVLVRWLV